MVHIAHHYHDFSQYIIIKARASSLQKGMSSETLTPVNNDVRYQIKLKYYKEGSFVIYEMIVLDLAMGKQDLLLFRFSQIKKFHQDLMKKQKSAKEGLPEFPKTNSFAFWNKTNSNPRMIEDRRRQLEYYFTKLFNNPILRGLKQVKVLLKYAVRERRRTRSMNFTDKTSVKISKNEQRKRERVHSQPKIIFSNISTLPRSVRDELFNLS